jgi:hypothetical protein
MGHPHESTTGSPRVRAGLALGVLLCTAGFWPAAGYAAGSGGASACQKTARLMQSACVNDVMEESKVTRANCLNISAATERRQCQNEARELVREESESCDEQHEARREVCSLLDEDIYDPDPLLDPSITFVHPDSIPGTNPANPYLSLEAGRTLVLRGGEDFEEVVVVHVTDEIREIQGVPCRVVVDAAMVAEENGGGVEYEAEEVTDDWYAQDSAGDVYYCGELSRNFEDGALDNIDGSFEAGKAFAKAGTLVKAMPMAGDAHRQEFALGEAEDVVQYLDLAAVPSAAEGGENADFPCAPAGCLKTLEINPLEPEASEFKYYLAGVGFVLAVPFEDGELTGEREELACAGDSLDVLTDPACGIEDPEQLLEALCLQAPETFCEA